MSDEETALTFPATSRKVLRRALRNFETETLRYLSSYQPVDEACCTTEALRRASNQPAIDQLAEQLEHIRAALNVIGCGGHGQHIGQWHSVQGSDSLAQCSSCGEVIGK
jgi:exo-beta-1,3-glucanase (GH17 family)